MLLSNIGNHDIPYYRMELAILCLVRGSLYRRLSANERQAAAIETIVYSLIHSIVDLHCFRERRQFNRHRIDKKPVKSTCIHKKIMDDIIKESRMVKEVILDRPFECNIDMNFILTNLDKIIARHTESEVQTQSKPQTLLAVESSESKEHNIIAVRKNPTPFLPKINTFLTAAVGNILYEQGEYTDIGTLDKGESIHGSKESRAN